MRTKENEMKETKRNARPGYNTYYNKTVLETLDLIIENDDVWLSSIDLANISGRTHDNVLKDIRRDIMSLYNNLGLKKTITNHFESKGIGFVKFHEGSKLNLSEVVNVAKDLSKKYIDENSFDYDVVGELDIITKYRQTSGGVYEYYLLNSRASLMCLMRYSPIVRAYVSNLFLKTVDMMKAKGYEIESAKDMYMSIDEEINNSIDTLESDLEEDGLLSEFNMWHLVWLLFRKIPKSIAKYFSKEFPQFYEMYDNAVRHGDFSSPYFDDPDKKGKGEF